MRESLSGETQNVGNNKTKNKRETANGGIILQELRIQNEHKITKTKNTISPSMIQLCCETLGVCVVPTNFSSTFLYLSEDGNTPNEISCGF